MTRPNPIATADLLRSLAECWGELDGMLTRATPNRNHSTPAGRPPLDLDVLDAKRAIDEFAMTYAHMLMDDDPTWAPPTGTPQMLHGLALRVGHFVSEAQDARIAHEFAEELRRISDEAWPIARPNGIGRIPVGPCAEDGCAGTMRAVIDRDKIEAMSLRELWDKTLRCTEDSSHVLLLGMYAREASGLDEHEIAALVAVRLAEVA